MKSIRKCLALVLCLALTLTAGPAVLALEPEIPAPEESVKTFMEHILGWKPDQAAALLSDTLEYREVVDACEQSAKPLLERLEYTVGNSRIEENTAEVDIAVTAADIREPMRQILADALACAAVRSLMKLPFDADAFLAARIIQALDAENLTTIKTNATVHLIRGGDGDWKLDLSNPDNLNFAEAITGGLLDYAQTANALLVMQEHLKEIPPSPETLVSD